jgi:hypothetical protein
MTSEVRIGSNQGSFSFVFHYLDAGADGDLLSRRAKQSKALIDVFNSQADVTPNFGAESFDSLVVSHQLAGIVDRELLGLTPLGTGQRLLAADSGGR